MKRVLLFTLLLSASWLAAPRVCASETMLALSNAPDLGQMTSSNLLDPNVTNAATVEANFQHQMELAHQQRLSRDFGAAAKTLVGLLNMDVPVERKRQAMFDLALNTQDDGQLVKAQQIFSQYVHVYPEDPSVPEVLLRQGLLFRQMGVNTFALSKFYAVMSTALKLKLDSIDYYKRIVLQAQTEIADTYYLDGKFEAAVDFFTRIVKSDSPSLNKEQIEYKLVRSLGYLSNRTETVNYARSFLEHYSNSTDVAEIRFLYASALKDVGRNQDSMRQVLTLLQSQQDNVQKNPELWAYWQRRAGNEIANQLYKEGDYLDALEIYLNLTPLDPSITWQAPVLYQSGLVYEQLQQWQKATDTYTAITSRTNELTEAVATPMLKSLFEMAQWRKDYLAWMERARATNSYLSLSLISTNTPSNGTK
ncbi:MAG TPA: tetratricopeptide repeat protein [Verrucomicrobiae bacterium]|nr:tetratricopeptide repeat protein [Verrucomicrobiae bacterium]